MDEPNRSLFAREKRIRGEDRFVTAVSEFLFLLPGDSFTAIFIDDASGRVSWRNR